MWLLLRLVFGLLDEFIERVDDALFDALHSLARPALSEPAANIVHAARDVVERFVFQAGEIVMHEVGQLLVAGRQAVLPLQQLGERASALLG